MPEELRSERAIVQPLSQLWTWQFQLRQCLMIISAQALPLDIERMYHAREGVCQTSCEKDP